MNDRRGMNLSPEVPNKRRRLKSATEDKDEKEDKNKIWIVGSNGTIDNSKITVETSLLATLYNDEDMADVIFLVGEEPSVWRIAGHKLVLSKGSPVFRTMFQSNLAEKETGANVRIPDINAKAFQELLRYLYTGIIEIENLQEALNLHQAAHKYMITSLVDLCIDYLNSIVDLKNVLEIYENISLYDGEYDNASLVLRCLKIIDEKIESLLDTNKFCNLRYNTLKDITYRGNLNLCFETNMFNALLRWACHECKRLHLSLTTENKRNVLGSILFNVRFSTIDRISFLEGPAKSGILTDEEQKMIVSHISNGNDISPREFYSNFFLSRFSYPIRYENNNIFEHCLSFTLDRDVILENVELTAECKQCNYSYYYDNGVHMQLSDDNQLIAEVMHQQGERVPALNVSGFTLSFKNPIFLKSNKQYKLYAWVNSPLKIAITSRGYSTTTWDDGICAYRLVQWQDCPLPSGGENGTTVVKGQHFSLHVYV